MYMFANESYVVIYRGQIDMQIRVVLVYTSWLLKSIYTIKYYTDNIQEVA